MKPLENIKVIELSTMITASFAAMMMAEQGAAVIKVEPIDMGDPMRYVGTAKGGMSALFANCNRGKQSIRVDLKQAAGQKIVRQMAEAADVLIHNFRPGVMDQLDLGSETLRALNPGLIYTAISGFGTDGPLRQAPAYDPIVQAHAGFTALQATAETPAFMRTLICDKVTAYTACQGITAALLQRAHTGAGQHIDISMLDASLFFLWPDGFMNHTLLDDDVELKPHIREVYNLTLTKDGAAIISAGTDKQVQGVFKAIDRDDLCDDPRFSSMAARAENIEALVSILGESFSNTTTDELISNLGKEDVPCAKCLQFNEVIEQPQISANESIDIGTHPQMGRMNLLKSPVRFAGERLPLASHSPGHGDNTRDVLLTHGYTDREIEQMMTDKVVL